MKKLLIVLITFSIFECNIIYASTVNIDAPNSHTYSISTFKHDDIIRFVYKGYKSLLESTKDYHEYTYDRYVQGKTSQKDLSIKEQYCHGDKTCINNDYIPSMKWNAYNRDKYAIPFFTAANQVFQNKVDVMDGKAKEFDYIASKYGQYNYNSIIKNRSSLDIAFDKYISKERELLSSGKFTAIIDKTYEQKPIKTYYPYVYYIGWKKLEDLKAKLKTDSNKAIVEYFQYRLISDERLYIGK